MAATATPVRWLGIAGASGLLAVHVIAPGAVDRAAVALAVGGILLGVPHGAADHLVPFWSRNRAVTPAALGRVLGGYVVTLLVALACVVTFPVATVWGFLLASALHFGRAEVVVSAELTGRPVPRVGQDVLPALAHGAVTVGLPLALWSPVSLPVLDGMAPGMGTTGRPLLEAIVVATAVLVVSAGVSLVRAGRWFDAGELLLLVALFAVVTPLAAFGVYFGLWHAARHTARLVRLPGRDGCVDVRAGTLRYVRGAALPTIGAVGLLLLMWRTTNPSVLAAALATLVALTAPHLGVVAALDQRAARLTSGSSGFHG